MGLLRPNTDKFVEVIDKGKYVMLWRITLFFILAFLLLTVATFFYDKTSSVIYAILFLLAVSCLCYLIFFKELRPVLWLYTICGTIMLAFSFNINNGLVHIPDYFWAFAVTIFAFTSLGSRVGWLIILAFACIVFYHCFFHLNMQLLQYKQHTLLELAGISAEIIVSLSVTGYFISQHLLFTKYTEGQMSLANAELEFQNTIIQRKSDENSTLIKEIHHRVKNNLQIIVSLLRMHREEVKTEDAKRDFDEAIGRILSMSLLHQQMYREKELSRLNMEEYLKSLSHEIIETYRKDDQHIKCDIHAPITHLKLESIVPLGLMVNELITNSLKHAFSNSSKGCIGIFLEGRGDAGFYMRYSDDGSWIDDQLFESGFGQELVNMLAEQMNGRIARHGSTYELVVESPD